MYEMSAEEFLLKLYLKIREDIRKLKKVTNKIERDKIITRLLSVFDYLIALTNSTDLQKQYLEIQKELTLNEFDKVEERIDKWIS